MKEFPGEVGHQDFSGFERDEWIPRTEEEHRETANKLRMCKTKNEQLQIESSTGYRYSSLLELTYFNPTRMLLIDPMHNLFLGTAKHCLKSIWSNSGILTLEKFQVIQSRIDSCIVPSDIGRIPHKILSGFSSFTADQFKNWIIYFFLVCLRDILDKNNLECWRHFVLGCRLLCTRSITHEKAKLADAFLLQFCRRIQRMHGCSAITPNMHFHNHLYECIKDFGPIHAFWLFSFERFNGILGKQPITTGQLKFSLWIAF